MMIIIKENIGKNAIFCSLYTRQQYIFSFQICLYSFIILEMQIQKAGPIETHNLMLSTFLPSNQIKYSSFVKIDAPKSIIRQNIEHKFLTGLIAATTNTLKLYTLYQNAIALQVGSWRMHEDIKGVIGWDKIIIVTIGQKLAGFKYQGGMLKNAFLISLQFLPIDDQDNCTIYADRLGYYLVIYIKNYLVLCFSQTLATKYRSRVLERTKMELVSQDMRWNEPGKNYILDVVKLKLIDVQINKIEQIQIMDETIYFIGHKNKEKILYFIHAYYFFNSIQSSHAISIVPQKDQLPPNSKFIVFHPHHGPRLNANRQPEFIYQNMENGVITLKSQHMTMDVGKFDGDFQIFHHHGQNLFPLLIWEKEKGLLSLIQKQKTFQQNYDFKIRPIENDKPIDTLIYRQGVIMIASRSGLYLLNIINSVGLPTKIHHSLGSIIDFHIGKDMLIIQNSQKKQTKLYQLTKGPRIDPKPFVTHKKKMFLESLSDLIAIYSFVIGKKKLQILAVKRGTGSNKMFTFYREGLIQFQKILQDIKEYQQLNINSEKLLLVQTKADKTEVLTYNQQGGFNSQQLQWFGWKRQKRWCQLQYIISYDDKILSFFHILTKKQINFELIKSQTNFINIFINFRKITIDRNLKDHQFVQVYFVYGKKLEIYTLDLTIQQKYLVHVSDSIHQGSPILSNELMYPGIHQTDLYRSHTCPQYNMNQHGLRFLAVKANSVISAYLYHNKNDTYLIFITSEQFILIYKKYFNPEDGGFIFRRKITPLNLIKNFKWSGEKSFMNLGQGIVKFGNLLIYKGQIVQSIITRSLFRMEGSLWGLLSEGKIRMIHLGSEVYEGFCIRQIQTGITEELMGIQSTSQYYCVYSRKGFEIFSKDYVSHWRFTLGNETIVCLRMFEHYIGMSYYDYYSDQQGINDYNSIRFRFRIYNCATKNKIIEREKPLDEPILHIRFMSPDKLILVTSSLIFVNILKNDKSLQLFRTHNFSSKRSFLSSFAYIPDILPPSFGAQGSPCFMLFGGSHGGLGFFVGKWIQQEKLKEQWFEGFRCGIRQVTFFRFGEEREELLKSLIADQDGNLIVLTLKVDQAQKIADIRLGGLVNSFKTKSGSEKVIYCSMSDGSIKLMTAIKLDGSEVTYMDFQKTFCEQLPFYGGFNLRASRKLQQKYRSSKIVSKGNVLDGDILEAFFSLTEALKAYILQTSDMELGPIKSIITF